MVDFVQPNRALQARPAAQVSTATGQGLKGLSQATAKAADTFTDYFEEEAREANDLLFAKAQDKWATYLTETGKDAQKGYGDTVMSKYDEYVAAVLSESPERGKDDLRHAFDKHRISLNTKAHGVEIAARARRAAAARAAAKNDAYRARANALVSDPSLLQDVMEQDPKNADAYVKIAANARAMTDPEGVAQEFQDGKWDAHVSPSEKMSFIEAGYSAAARREREEAAQIKVAQNDLADAAEEEVAFAMANGYVPVDSEVTPEAVADLYPPEEAAAFMVRYNDAVDFSKTLHSVNTATPDQIAEAVTKITTDVQAPGDTVADVQKQSDLFRAINERNKSLTDDAATHAQTHNDDVRLRFEAYQNADDESRQIAASQYAAALNGEYDRLGVPVELRNALPKPVAKQMVEGIVSAGPDVAPQMLANVVQDFGARAMVDLKKNGLLDEYVEAMRHTDNPGLAQRIAALAGVTDATLKEGLAEDITGLDDELNAAIDDYTQSFMAGGVTSQASETLAGAVSVARRLVLADMKGGKSMSKAIEDVASQMFPETVVNRPGNMQVIAPQNLDSAEVERALENSRSEFHIRQFNPVPLDYPGLDYEGDEEFTQLAARGGVWVNNATGDGAMLMLQTKTGYLIPLIDADGKYYEVKFERMPTLAIEGTLNDPLRQE